MSQLLPISALLPTRDRPLSLDKMLHSLALQAEQPAEIIVIDASDDEQTKELCQPKLHNLDSKLIYRRATETGAASQRNQALQYATYDTIWLIEDDITLEADCLTRLWQALQSDHNLGGVNAMITNQKYSPPGKISSLLFRFFHGRQESSYAGKCIGPALNLLPEDSPNLPEIVPVDWLNTTCVLYRREALPQPMFSSFFTGYSLLEDVALSLTVGKQWRLANVRTAHIFHDSQPGEHKNNLGVLAKMDLVNRHYVMTQILERKSYQDYFKLAIFQVFNLAGFVASSQNWRAIPEIVWGKVRAIAEITFNQHQNNQLGANNCSPVN